jgi:hypothetical protein
MPLSVKDTHKQNPCDRVIDKFFLLMCAPVTADPIVVVVDFGLNNTIEISLNR